MLTSLPPVNRYRVSPFTYLIDGMLSTAVAHTQVTCAKNEYVHFSPPSGQTCGEYMQDYIDVAGGYLQDTRATGNCSFCAVRDTDAFLSSVASNPHHMWRNFGIMWAFIVFNIFGAVALYWLVRVPKKKKNKSEEVSEPVMKAAPAQNETENANEKVAS